MTNCPLFTHQLGALFGVYNGFSLPVYEVGFSLLHVGDLFFVRESLPLCIPSAK